MTTPGFYTHNQPPEGAGPVIAIITVVLLFWLSDYLAFLPALLIAGAVGALLTWVDRS